MTNPKIKTKSNKWWGRYRDKNGGERILRCLGGPSCVAKNRFGLPEEVPLSWPALLAALSNDHPSQE